MKRNADSKHTLVLHIGTAKTGTTSIQKFLSDNAEELRRYGWYYPPFTKIWYQMERGWSPLKLKNGYVFRHSLLDRWDKERMLRLWGLLRSYLIRYNVILSEEAIWGHPAVDTVKTIRFIKKMYPNIKIIVYLRRQDLYAEALWNQRVKRDAIRVGSMREYLKDPRLKKTMDYYTILRGIEHLIGRENMVVHVFEKECLAQGDLIQDFFTSLEIPVDWNHLIYHRGGENERLDVDLLAVKRIFNKTYAEYISDIDRPSTIVMKNYIDAIRPDKKRFGYMTLEEREDILQRYEKGNQKVAKRYLNKKDGILFQNRNIQIPVYDANITEREKRIIRLFAKIAAEQDNEMEEMKQQKPLDYLKKTVSYIIRHVLIRLKRVLYPFIVLLLPYL